MPLQLRPKVLKNLETKLTEELLLYSNKPQRQQQILETHEKYTDSRNIVNEEKLKQKLVELGLTHEQYIELPLNSRRDILLSIAQKDLVAQHYKDIDRSHVELIVDQQAYHLSSRDTSEKIFHDFAARIDQQIIMFLSQAIDGFLLTPIFDNIFSKDQFLFIWCHATPDFQPHRYTAEKMIDGTYNINISNQIGGIMSSSDLYNPFKASEDNKITYTINVNFVTNKVKILDYRIPDLRTYKSLKGDNPNLKHIYNIIKNGFMLKVFDYILAPFKYLINLFTKNNKQPNTSTGTDATIQPQDIQTLDTTSVTAMRNVTSSVGSTPSNESRSADVNSDSGSDSGSPPLEPAGDHHSSSTRNPITAVHDSQRATRSHLDTDQWPPLGTNPRKK